MFSSAMPNVWDTRRRPLAGDWLADQSSSLPSLKCAVVFCGSSGAWARNGIVVRRLDRLRRRRHPGIGVAVLAQRSLWRLLRQRLCLTSKAVAALLARWRPRPTARAAFRGPSSPATRYPRRSATPGIRPARFVVPSMTNACFTPGIALISSRLALTTLPPNTGHFSNTACSMPGTVTSMPKIGLPVTIAGPSTFRVGLPMILKSFGSLSGTDSRAGGVIVAAFASNSVYASRRRDCRMEHGTADAVVHSASGTLHVCAAAATSIARPAAPTRRIGSQLFGVALLPPALWPWNFVVSRSPCSIADLVPVHVELLGDQHREHRLHALPDLRVLGDDRDEAVRRQLDEGVRRERSALRRRHRLEPAEWLERGGDEDTAARERRDLEELPPVDLVVPTLVDSMVSLLRFRRVKGGTSGRHPLRRGGHHFRRPPPSSPRGGSPRECGDRWHTGRCSRSSRDRCPGPSAARCAPAARTPT